MVVVGIAPGLHTPARRMRINDVGNGTIVMNKAIKFEETFRYNCPKPLKEGDSNEQRVRLLTRKTRNMR